MLLGAQPCTAVILGTHGQLCAADIHGPPESFRSAQRCAGEVRDIYEQLCAVEIPGIHERLLGAE